jgi:hypothetical protein
MQVRSCFALLMRAHLTSWCLGIITRYWRCGGRPDRAGVDSTRLQARWAAVVFSGLILAACGGNSDDGYSGAAQSPAAQTPVAPLPSAVIETSVSSGTASIQKPVTFTAKSLKNGQPVARYEWSFDDGQSATGETVTLSFKAAALMRGTVKAIAADGTVLATSNVSLSVLEQGANAPAAFGLPTLFGDLDGNGALELADALILAQSVNGLTALNANQINAADLDLNGRADATDLRLLSQALLDDAPLPSAALKTSVYPGAVLALVSPALLGVDDAITIRIGGISTPPPMRAVPGYASVVVPTAGMVPGSAVPIEIVVNGAVAQTLAIEVRAPLVMPADPVADIFRFLDEWKESVALQQSALQRQIASGGISTAQSDLLLAPGVKALSMIDAATVDLRTALSAPGGDALARVIQQAMYANGLQDFRASLQNARSSAAGTLQSGAEKALIAKKALTPDQVCDVLVPGLCRVRKAVDLLDNAGTIITTACTVASIAAFTGGVIFPADGPLIEAGALATFVNVCVPLAVVDSVGTVATLLFSPLKPTLTATATPSSLGQDQAAILTAKVNFLGLEGVCAEGGSALLGEALNKVLGKRIVGRLLTSNALFSRLADVFAKVGESAYVKLLEQIQGSATAALEAVVPLNDALKGLIGTPCSSVTGGGSLVPVRRVFASIPPEDGSLTSNADGTGSYLCPTPGPSSKSSITLNGELKLCDDSPAKVSVSVACAARQVTITMGDNGSAVDDIYEVAVNGQTVLTSSQPVTSTSKTITLPAGQTTVTMRGLAAPDGIGTYFISFSGARLVSGATLTGRDLTPGVVKSFVIEVL